MGATSEQLLALRDHRSRVFDAVRDSLVDQLAIEPEEISPDADLVLDLAIESIDAIDVLASLERTLGVTMRVREFMGVRTIGDLVDCIVKVLGSASVTTPDR